MNMTPGKQPFQLFDYQKPARNKIIDWVKENNPSEVHTLVSCMRSGKTGIVCNAISHIVPHGFRVWIAVDRIELVDQWLKSLGDFAPNVRSIGFITSDKMSPGASVVIVQLQTLARRLKDLHPRFAPHILFYDEAHTTAFTKVCGQARLKFPNTIQINLTATPVRHGSSNVQYEDVYPRKNWFVGATAKQMIKIGRWKIPNYILASSSLAEETAKRFSGVKVVRGEFDETSQAKVMIDLLPKHLAEVLPKIGDRTVIWMAVNTDHAQQIYNALDNLKLSSGFISGDEKLTKYNVDLGKYRNCRNDRAKIIEAHRDGTIKHLVNISTVTTGYDNPLASVVVWLRKTMSVSLWNQASGRALSGHPDNADGLIFDMVGNLGLHPCPEDIDWLDYNASDKSFRDPWMYICKNCGYRHESIPVPLHPTNPRNYKFLISVGYFPDDDNLTQFQINKTSLRCHNCLCKVCFDPIKLESYGQWLQSLKSVHAGVSKFKKFEHDSVGISIGTELDHPYVLTPNDLYDAGVWNLSDGMPERDPFKDKSKEYLSVYSKAVETVDFKALEAKKLSLMNDAQRDRLDGLTVADIHMIDRQDLRYKVGLAVAYVKNYSPIWAYSKFWHDKLNNPSDELLKGFFNKLIQGNPEVHKLVNQWLLHHIGKYEEVQNRRSAGLLKSWINKFLVNKG